MGCRRIVTHTTTRNGHVVLENGILYSGGAVDIEHATAGILIFNIIRGCGKATGNNKSIQHNCSISMDTGDYIEGVVG